MKSIVFILMVILTVDVYSQTACDILNPSVQIIFLGCDYSHVRFTKSDQFNDHQKVLDFFPYCNGVLNKFEYGKKVNENTINDFYFTNSRNAKINFNDVFSDEIDYTLSDSDIKSMIHDLDIDKKTYRDKIGVVFCEENYSKTKHKASLVIVFFRINDSEILFSKRVAYKPDNGLYQSGFYRWEYVNRKAGYYMNGLKKEIRKSYCQ